MRGFTIYAATPLLAGVPVHVVAARPADCHRRSLDHLACSLYNPGT
jgi:hypothetical protein